jgi:accessory Sec system glycosyltransferase GtfB
MAELTGNKKIVLLLDNYNTSGRDLHISFELAGYDCFTAVIESDGFEPDSVVSVYGYFLGEFKGKDGVPGKPRFFNQIDVPAYWEIRGTNQNGQIFDHEKERGRIFYAAPANKRLVKTVDWYDEQGIVRFSDHYNRFGAVYARTAFDAKGQRVNRTYFSAEGKEIIVENFVTNDIILNHGEEVKFFKHKKELVAYFLKLCGLENSRIFFNSLSTPFFVSNILDGEKGQDILFWQESVGKEIPGNMQFILRGETKRTEKIFVQKRQAYNRLLELGADKSRMQLLGFIYPFLKENAHQPKALICTNSDNIEKCSDIVNALPEMEFYITAVTEMSSKLLRMGSYTNVHLYPNVKMSVLERLFMECDWYLDINHSIEILSAVRQAFMHNHLIMSFRETLHSSEYIAAAHIYNANEYKRMISDIKLCIADGQVMDRCLKRQHETALAESPEAYRRW